MIKSRRVPAAIAVSFLSLGVLFAACSSSSAEVVTLSTSEYYAQVAQLDAGVARDIEDIERFGGELSRLDEPTAVAVIIRLQAKTVGTFADGLEVLRPPASLAGVHAEAVVGANQINGAFVKAVERIEFEPSTGTLDEMYSRAFEGYDFTTMFDRYNAACLKIEGAAALEQVQLDLDCDE